MSLEIPHFLTDDECEHVISLAKEAGLSASQVAIKFDEKDLNEVLKQVGGYAQLQQSFPRLVLERAYSRCAQRGLIF